MAITQKELLESEFEAEGNEIFGGILRTGLYSLVGTSKVGKSLIATSLANHVATGTEYLGMNMPKGKALYIDLDNYDYETKSRIKALNFEPNENVVYEFDDINSIYKIECYLDSLRDIEDYRLVIIDSLINLTDFANSIDDYNEVYPTIKKLRDIIVSKNLVGIFIHHTKKENAKSDQDKVLGSKAITACCTGTIFLSVSNEFSKTGELRFILRNKTTIIHIKKDTNNINWVLDDKHECGEDIPRDLLNIINAVVLSKEHKLIGTCQDIAAMTKITFNPASITKYLKQNIDFLTENNITFSNSRVNQKRIITIIYHENGIEQNEEMTV